MLVGAHVCFDCMQIREDGFNLTVMSLNVNNVECVHKILQTGFTNWFYKQVTTEHTWGNTSSAL